MNANVPPLNLTNRGEPEDLVPFGSLEDEQQTDILRNIVAALENRQWAICGSFALYCWARHYGLGFQRIPNDIDLVDTNHIQGAEALGSQPNVEVIGSSNVAKEGWRLAITMNNLMVGVDILGDANLDRYFVVYLGIEIPVVSLQKIKEKMLTKTWGEDEHDKRILHQLIAISRTRRVT